MERRKILLDRQTGNDAREIGKYCRLLKSLSAISIVDGARIGLVIVMLILYCELYANIDYSNNSIFCHRFEHSKRENVR